MGRIPDATIQEIRDRADIVGLIGRYVELKQAGRNHKGLCPFHDEKTPSFNVNPDRGIFHCFGCEAGGDVIGFMMRYENLSFPEAVRSLAADLGIEVPEEGGSAGRDESKGLFAALDLAQRCYREALTSAGGRPGADYLRQRGLDPETIERFGLGFVPDRWDTVTSALRAAGISSEVGETAGLILARQKGDGHYDRLRGRITFPIRDVRGRVIGFGGRALSKEQEPKYLNTPETPVFRKRTSFYGFPQALEPIRRSGRVIICEGYFDAIALARAGMGEALATCGTALTPDHAKQLRRRTTNVFLLFDGDAAGQKAMERAMAVLLPEGLRIRAVLLPDGQDPDDFLAARGADALRAVVERAPEALEVVLRRAISMGCQTPAEKADAVRHVAPLVARVENPVERTEWARRVAVATASDPRAVDAIVRQVGSGRSVPATQEVAVATPRPPARTPYDRQLSELATIFVHAPGLANPELCERLRTILPDGRWKTLIIQLLDAAEVGCIDESGALDLAALEDRLDESDLVALRGLVMGGQKDLVEASPANELVRYLDWFEDKYRKWEEQEVTRRLHDPQEDMQALLERKQALLEKKRAAVGISPGMTAPRSLEIQ